MGILRDSDDLSNHQSVEGRQQAIAALEAQLATLMGDARNLADDMVSRSNDPRLREVLDAQLASMDAALRQNIERFSRRTA